MVLTLFRGIMLVEMWQEAQGEDDRRSLTEVTHWVGCCRGNSVINPNFTHIQSHPQIHELYYRFICASGMDLYPLDFKAAGLLGNLKYLQLEDWLTRRSRRLQFSLQPYITLYGRSSESEAAII
ncbi:hypothetical protein CK203_055656 [Vitis vinifera]|uniref:Uncharacterized protein n=1 Tax=Vitis vinifera TaxID=29760 RepID=A0A438FT77_VITVI|nr:hypothetical protein CK203_055656 [Vitis vinifera]